MFSFAYFNISSFTPSLLWFIRDRERDRKREKKNVINNRCTVKYEIYWRITYLLRDRYVFIFTDRQIHKHLYAYAYQKLECPKMNLLN